MCRKRSRTYWTETVAFLVIIAPIADAVNNASIIVSSSISYSLPIVTIAPGSIPQDKFNRTIKEI